MHAAIVHALRSFVLRWAAPLATLASAAMLFASIGVYGAWPLVWVAPMPIFLLAFRSSARTAAISAFVAWALGGMSIALPYLTLAPIPLLATMVVIPAFAFAVLVLVARFAEPHLPPELASLVFPCAWTGFDLVVSRTGGFGLAYTQLSFLPVMQVASLAGSAAVTFLVTYLPSALAVARHRQRYRTGWIAAAIFTAALVFGLSQLTQPNSHPPIKVGLAASDRTVGAFDATTAEEALPIVHAYAERVALLAEGGATLVVLPEKFVGIAPSYAADARAILAEAARSHQVTIVAGWNERDAAGIGHNVAHVFSANGDVVTSYEKRHLIPFFEDGYATGSGIKLVPGTSPPWGVAICKDMDFPDLGAEYGAAGVGLMLVPGWDFVKDAVLHGHMAILRGIENGYAVVRTAQEGLLTVSDRHGRIVEKESWLHDQVLLVASIEPGEGRTLYARTGDWFAMACPLAAAFLVFLANLRRPKELASRAGS